MYVTDIHGDVYMYLEEKANIIANYIKESRYTQAVMINGAWGVGKTFFVDNVLLNELKEYIVIRYSLYGVQSSEQIVYELQRKMLLKLIENKEFTVKGKNIKIPSKLLDIAPNAISVLWKKLGFESDDLNELINLVDYDKNKFIIVFDDLERAGMNINEVLGLINSYVECQKLKVIIIANEKEIGSSRISTDLPQKFVVASNPAISLKENTVNNHKKDDKSVDKVYNYSELIERTKTLFSSDIIYNSVKEKLIGLTVTINADFHQLYNQIVEKNANKSQQLLLQHKESVIELLQDLDCQNLRTLIFAIISFDKIFEVVNSLKDTHTDPQYIKILNDELTQIMRSVIITSILYKTGNTNNFTSDDYSSLQYFIRDSKEYSFINKYIYYHELNEEIIRNEINVLIEDAIARQKEEDEKDLLSYYKLNSFGWLDFNDDDVIRLSDQLYDELSKGKYDVRFFKNIIIYLIQLEYNFKEKRGKLKHTDEDYINLMEKYIQEHDLVERQLDLFEAFSDDGDFIKKYNSYVSPLITATNEKENSSANIEVKNMFESENWAEEFYQYCRDNHDKFLNSHSFLSSFEFDISVIKQHLSMATNSEIRVFSRAICSVYDFGNIRDFFKTDIVNLEKVIGILDEIYTNVKTNCTTKIVIKTYKEKLEGKLALLK